MYNSYLGNNQYYQGYSNTYNPYPTQIQQRQFQELPFNDVKFVTEDEAKAYIVLPNAKVMLMDRDKSMFYIKSADTLGKSTLEAFKYSKIDDNPTQQVLNENTPLEFVKTSDFNPFIEQLNLLKQEMENLKEKLNNNVEVINE